MGGGADSKDGLVKLIDCVYAKQKPLNFGAVFCLYLSQSMTVENRHALADFGLFVFIKCRKDSQIIALNVAHLCITNYLAMRIGDERVAPSLTSVIANVMRTALGAADHHALTV